MIARLGVSLTVGAFVTTYVIRSLSVKDYGIYTVLYSLIGYVSVIGSFGIPSVFQRFIPEALQKKEYSLLKKLVLRGLILRLLLSVATVSVILLLHGPIGRLLKLEGFLSYFSIFAWGIVLSLEASLMTSVLHSLFLHKYSVIASTIYSASRGICILVLLQIGWGILGVLCAEVASWGIWIALLGFFYHLKFLRRHPGRAETPLPLWRYCRYGGLSALNEMGSTILDVSTGFFIITAFLGPGAVALYAFADRVIKMFVCCMPHIVLIDVIRPSFFAKYAESGDTKHLSDMFNLLVKIGAFCVFPLAAGIFVLSDKMTAIVFKSEYLPAKPILWVLVAFTAFNVFDTPSALVLQSLERIQINLYSKIFAVCGVAAELLMVQWFGVMGVVLVTCSATLMKNLFLYYYANRYGGVSIDWCGMSAIIVNAGLMALVLWCLRPFAQGFLSLGLVGSLGVAAYLLFAWLNKAFNYQERGWVNRLIPTPIFVF